MKSILLVICLLFAGCASQFIKDREVRGEDVILYGWSLGCILLDYGQTLEIARNPDKWAEGNMLLPRHPSVTLVHQVFVSTLIIHTTLSWLIPAKYRLWWIGTVTGAECGAAYHNHGAGISPKF